LSKAAHRKENFLGNRTITKGRIRISNREIFLG
jgi:hypothetical protein